VAGLTALYTGPSWFVGTANFLVVPYVILALPYTYRALDVAMRALDLKTLTEAAQSLGAGQVTIHTKTTCTAVPSTIRMDTSA
jgi:putative spermidine/putrescine transport system permease protein